MNNDQGEIPESNVIDMVDRMPHVAGIAFCIVCDAHWRAVAMVGSTWLLCPDCGAERGIFKHRMTLDSGVPRFVCQCGCQVFMIHPDFAFCVGCGQRTYWEVCNPFSPPPPRGLRIEQQLQTDIRTNGEAPKAHSEDLP